MLFSMENRKSENRIAIAEWITAMMGIFFSVWWGFVFQRLVAKQTFVFTYWLLGNKEFEVDNPWFAGLALIPLVLFSTSYVHWLWRAQLFSTGRRIKRFEISTLFFLFTTTGVIASIWYLHTQTSLISINLIYFGMAITIAWPITVLVSLFLTN